MLSTFAIPMDELAQQRFEACDQEGHYIEKTGDNGEREAVRECYGICRVCNAEFVGVELVSGADEFGNLEYSPDHNSWKVAR